MLRKEIESVRPARQPVDSSQPVNCWWEWEPDGNGGVVKVAAIILTAAECPWRCVMCDLWKHTLIRSTPQGALPQQIESALETLPQDVRWIKLYNSGSFFDRRSVPPQDHQRIAELCKDFERVIVENHPKLSTTRIKPFADRLDTQLEIALGVETLQTGMLRRLNKGMNRDDIDKAISVHRKNGIDTRAFLLIRPPFTLEEESVAWTILTLRHLARLGVRHASLIPVRAGNGWLDKLASDGDFQPATFATIEKTFTNALQLEPRPQVTVDLWDWPDIDSTTTKPRDFCKYCALQRKSRLATMNLTQVAAAEILCPHCDAKTVKC